MTHTTGPGRFTTEPSAPKSNVLCAVNFLGFSVIAKKVAPAFMK